MPPFAALLRRSSSETDIIVFICQVKIAKMIVNFKILYENDFVVRFIFFANANRPTPKNPSQASMISTGWATSAPAPLPPQTRHHPGLKKIPSSIDAPPFPERRYQTQTSLPGRSRQAERLEPPTTSARTCHRSQACLRTAGDRFFWLMRAAPPNGRISERPMWRVLDSVASRVRCRAFQRSFRPDARPRRASSAGLSKTSCTGRRSARRD